MSETRLFLSLLLSLFLSLSLSLFNSLSLSLSLFLSLSHSIYLFPSLSLSLFPITSCSIKMKKQPSNYIYLSLVLLLARIYYFSLLTRSSISHEKRERDEISLMVRSCLQKHLTYPNLIQLNLAFKNVKSWFWSNISRRIDQFLIKPNSWKKRKEMLLGRALQGKRLKRQSWWWPPPIKLTFV